MRTYVERAEDFIKELLEYKGENTFKKEYGMSPKDYREKQLIRYD